MKNVGEVQAAAAVAQRIQSDEKRRRLLLRTEMLEQILTPLSKRWEVLRDPQSLCGEI
jgi:hypothetical protein